MFSTEAFFGKIPFFTAGLMSKKPPAVYFYFVGLQKPPKICFWERRFGFTFRHKGPVGCLILSTLCVFPFPLCTITEDQPTPLPDCEECEERRAHMDIVEGVCESCTFHCTTCPMTISIRPELWNDKLQESSFNIIEQTGT